MRKESLEKIRRGNLRKADMMKLSHKTGCVRVNPKNSFEHEVAKLYDVYKALKDGHKVATEVVSKDGKRRYDFMDFDTGEVREYEKNHKIEKKGATTVAI